MIGSLLLFVITLGHSCLSDDRLPISSHTMFPKGFKFGAATAAYQVEGGWNADGKGPSVWDKIVHYRPDIIANKDNGDVADDSYHLYKTDIQLLKDIGMYRFSISWPRVLPNGTLDEVNQVGLDYYTNLIDELIANGIEPVVTLYHWDHPQALEEIGGWQNPQMAQLFADYAGLMFTTYGEKVKYWITINEPLSIVKGYAEHAFTPDHNMTGVGDYIAGHNLLRAHAKAYRLYHNKFAYQGGKLSMAFSGDNCWPLTDSKQDIAAAERCFQFTFGWFAHPVFRGDYHAVMKENIDRNSKSEGRNASRLPVFTKQEINELKGSADFFGMNYYSAHMAQNGIAGPSPSRERDSEVLETFDSSWPNTSASDWMRDIPQGLRMLTRKVRDEYGNPIVLITENGISDDGSHPLDDNNRIHYYEGHLAELRRAVYEDGCNVIGHISWSIMDNFEWLDGYTKRFGLVKVDYSSPKRTRTWKKSAHWFHHFLAMHKLLE